MKKVLISVLFLYIFTTGGRVDAGGMYENVDVDGIHLTENTPVKVINQILILKGDTQALFYIQDGVVSDHLYTGTIAEQAVFTLQDKKLEIAPDSKVWFYESGELKYTTAIPEPTTFKVQGKEVLFAAQYDLYVPMGFHKNGSIRQGTLAEETTFMVQDKPVKIRGMSEFSETGQLLSGILVDDEVFIIQDKPIAFPAGNPVSFYRNGTVKECVYLGNDTFFRAQNKMVLFASTKKSYQGIYFFENGDVMYGSLAEDTLFKVQGRDLRLKELSIVMFYENGLLSSGGLSEDTYLRVQDKQVLFKAGKREYVLFYKSGALQNGYLAENTELIFKGKPVVIEENSYVEFDDQGTLVKYSLDEY